MTSDQRAIYEIFLKYSASGGNLTYEEWLDTIKGENGKDGLSLLTGHGAPSDEKGKTGDSYIDLDSWDFYVKGTQGWARQGNLKNPDVETFTVKWLDFDGTTLELDTNVEKGSTPAYGGVTPTRVNDSKYTYTFTGWSPKLEAVVSNQVYVAQYDSDEQTYTIIWKDYDGTVLETDENVDFGAIPTFDQAFPTRAEEESCTYEFSGWSPSVSRAIADQTYMATYQKTMKSFLVKFLNEDGSLLYSSMMSYGSAPIFNGTPTKKADAQYTYTFKGWDKDFEPVISAVTYSAVYDKKVNQYTVTWAASGYGTILSEKVEYGKIPVAPEESSIPAKSSTATLDYSFYGWDKEITAVTTDVTYNAVYFSQTRFYTVSWLDENGSQLKADKVEYNISIPSFSPTLGANKILKGWRTSLSSTTVVSFPYTVRSDVQFYSYTIDKYEYAYLPLTGTYSLTTCVGTVDITTIPTTFDDGTHGEKNVTEIGTEAFKGTAITSMIIPSTITKISERTFSECASLGTLYIPTSVTSILEGAIYGDSSLSIYCQAASKPSTWNDYWNVVHYFSEATYHSSADTFNKNIVWGYTH